MGDIILPIQLQLSDYNQHFLPTIPMKAKRLQPWPFTCQFDKNCGNDVSADDDNKRYRKISNMAIIVKVHGLKQIR